MLLGDAMKERIKNLRKSLGLSQTKFGESVGVSLSAEQKWEMGISVPSDAVIMLIVQRYGISEKWLRTGEGEMRAPAIRADELGRLVSRLMADRPDSFRSALITTLLRLDPDGPEWDAIERICNDISAEIKKNQEH